jgi:hypothetical protein
MTVVGCKYPRRRCQESQESGIKRRLPDGNLADREKMTRKRIPGSGGGGGARSYHRARGHGRKSVFQWRVPHPYRRLLRWPACLRAHNFSGSRYSHAGYTWRLVN